jgi:hypothetical protein
MFISVKPFTNWLGHVIELGVKEAGAGPKYGGSPAHAPMSISANMCIDTREQP